MTEPAKRPAAKKAAAPKRDDLPTDPEAATWEALTAPFPADWIERLPKPLKRGDDNKGRCTEPSGDQPCYYSADGHYCNGWHARSVHLDYVGHAGITMRLNDVLGPGGWDYQPYALDGDSMPIIGRQFYASLTIMGVTKWDLADNFSSAQEAYGDALRRCAMRFGIGTYLWSKSDHALNQAQTADVPPEPPVPTSAGTPESNPETYAPNGQPWRLADGTANPDALPPHQRAVWDAIATLVPPEPSAYNEWHQATMPRLRDLDEAQAQACVQHIAEMVAARPPA